MGNQFRLPIEILFIFHWLKVKFQELIDIIIKRVVLHHKTDEFVIDPILNSRILVVNIAYCL